MQLNDRYVNMAALINTKKISLCFACTFFKGEKKIVVHVFGFSCIIIILYFFVLDSYLLEIWRS